MTKKVLGTVLVGMAYLLHQDFWHWKVSRPVILGIFPIGLFYHLVYTIAVVALMAWLVRYAWPSHLELGSESPDVADGGKGQPPEEA